MKLTNLHRDEYRKKVQAEAKKMREEYGSAEAYADANFNTYLHGNEMIDNSIDCAMYYDSIQDLADNEFFWQKMAFVFSCYEIQDNPKEEELPSIDDLF